MEFVTEILAMVEELLKFLNEGEAAGIIDIVKNALADILALIPVQL